jgi:DNA-binding CsgD family transcriptional regulator/riboflavin transporter FmnP
MTQLNPLTRREWEVVSLLLQGKSNKLIGLSLGISDRTVEFHLKNIYAKYQVSTRVELILKLGNGTGKPSFEKLGTSTVDRQLENAENRDTPHRRTERGTSVGDTVSMIGKELQMKNLLNNRHVPLGVITALLTGSLWFALLQRFGHASLDSIQPWILPLGIIMIALGAFLGLIGMRNGNSPAKVFLSTLLGTGLGSFLMLPLTVGVVYPLGKLAETLGLVNRTALSTDVTTTLVYSAMLAIWLITGITSGTIVLHLAFHRSRPVELQRPASEHGL